MFIFLIVESSSQLKKTLQRRTKIIIGRYQKGKEKPCLSLMNKFNFLVVVQHFDAQNSVKRKKKKHVVYNYATFQNILKNQRAEFNLILT